MDTTEQNAVLRPPHYELLKTRRDFLLRAGAGFGALALTELLTDHCLLTTPALGAVAKYDSNHNVPHYLPRAKSVIFLFMEGGPSHLDLFDPKPLLNKLHGQTLPESFGTVITAMGESRSPLLESKRKWKQHGDSGIWVSDWLPHVAGCIDDISVIRSCWGTGLNHAGGVCLMNTGSTMGGRPSLGSWVSYGLGSENQNLPAFVVLLDNPTKPVNGPRNWGNGFMSASYQGVQFESGSEPIGNLNTPESIGSSRQQAKREYLHQLNRAHASRQPDDSRLEARIKSYELAFRMQAEAPQAVDLSTETEATKQLYGMDEKETSAFGRNCLLARRLVERGVRFIQLYHGSGSKWDSHDNIETKHAGLCRSSDKPIAGLLKDLKQRGLLDETLVVWGGEFGRTPMSEKGNGRDHNPFGFTMWMAGGGVKGGQVIGATDELGLRAIEDKLHVHDLHATILHLMGIDHTKLVYLHKGRPERIDINDGTAYKKITSG